MARTVGIANQPTALTAEQPTSSANAPLVVGLEFPGEADGTKGGSQLAISPSFDIAKSWRLSLEFWAPSFARGRHDIFFWGDERSGHDALVLGLNGFSLSALASHEMRERGEACPTLTTHLSGVHSRRWIATCFEYDAATGKFSLTVDGKRAGQTTSPVTPTIDRPMPVYLCHACGNWRFSGRVRNVRLANVQSVNP
jgi:hypothetical protein